MANNSKFTEDWLPIKDIKNGFIELEGKYYVTGIKIEPKNIFILDYTEQQAIIFNFRNIYNSIDYEFWLMVADRPVDINMYLAQLQLAYNQAPNQQIRKLIGQDIEKGERFRSTEINAVDTEYFIIFRDKKIETLQKRVQQLISNFASCGLNTKHVSDDDLRTLLNSFLNGNRNSTFGTVMTSE